MNKKQIKATAYHYTLIMLIVVAIAYRGGRDYLFHKNEAEVTVTLKDVQEIYPTAADFTRNRYGALDVFDINGNSTGTALLSTEYSQPFGYGGYVPLLIGIDNSLTITNIVLLPNNESSDYLQAIKGNSFLGKWIGASLADAINIDVDAVSGATLTSNAIKTGLWNTASHVMNTDAVAISKVKPWAIVKDVLFLVLILLSVVIAYKKGTARYRVIYLFLVLIIMGLLLNNALSVQLLNSWLRNGFGWRANWQSIVLLILALTVSFLGKRKFYCNYLCPMGALQELTNHFSPFKKRLLPTKFKGITVREVYLTLIAGALVLGFSPELSYAEPFMFFSFRIAGLAVILFGVLVILSSLFFTKPWCSLCPTGCTLDTITYKKNFK